MICDPENPTDLDDRTMATSPSATPTQYVWFGGTGDFGHSSDWSPKGVPASGDSASISAGTVRASNGSLADVDINIGSKAPDNDPILALRNETVGDVQVVTTEYQPEDDPDPTRYADITVAGKVTTAGAIDVGETSVVGTGVPGNLDIRLARGATLHVTGSLSAFADSSVSITGQQHSVLINDGQIDSGGADLDIDTSVVGNGTFAVARGKFAGGTLTFDRGVAAGEHVDVSQGGALNLTKPMEFLGSIAENPFGKVVLATDFTSASYANGVLTVLNHARTVAALHITSFDDMGFSVAAVDGQTVITTPGSIGSSMMNQPAAMVAIQTDHHTSI
jgi:hypothetical protein